MRKHWRGLVATALATSCVLYGNSARLTQAAGAPGALVFVAAGQVAVLEAGNLTTVGPGQSPVWSPDGTGLLYITTDFIGNSADIYLANTHGVNGHKVVSHAYPWINPSWSPDSKYIVYTAPTTTLPPALPNAPTKPHTIQLEVRALNVASNKVRVLGRISFTAGCSTKVTALQDAFAKAEGSYWGTPSTLIWAQPNVLAVQSTCTGQGLSVFKLAGGKPTSLSGWSGGVLSPDGKTIAAVVTPSAKGATSAQIGLINVASGQTQLLSPKLSVASVAWSPDNKALFAAVQPKDTLAGFAHVVRVTRDGKSAKSLGTIQAAGIFHFSLDPTGTSLAMTVVASGSANAVVPPQAVVYNVVTTASGVAHPLVQGGEAAWRP